MSDLLWAVPLLVACWVLPAWVDRRVRKAKEGFDKNDPRIAAERRIRDATGGES